MGILVRIGKNLSKNHYMNLSKNCYTGILVRIGKNLVRITSGILG